MLPASYQVPSRRYALQRRKAVPLALNNDHTARNVTRISGAGSLLAASCAVLFALLPAATASANTGTTPQAIRVEPYQPEPHDSFLPLLAGATQQLFRSDFDPSAAQWLPQRSKDGTARGRLPAGWLDFTGEGQAKARYSRIVEDGMAFLNLTAQSAKAGNDSIRVAIPLADIADNDLYRFDLHLRSTNVTPLEIWVAPSADVSKAVFHQKVTLDGSGWQEKTVNWQPKQQDHSEQPLYLVLGLAQAGNIDLAALNVQAINRNSIEKLIATNDDPRLHRDNLLRHSRFPLGMPSRWLLNRNISDDEVVIESESAYTNAPSGAPALRIATDTVTAHIYTDPFATARSWEPHVASLGINGKATGRLRVFKGFNAIAEQTFEIDEADGWQRVSVPFQPHTVLDEYYLHLELDGNARIDGLRVAAKSDPNAIQYAPAAATEVTLAHSSPARVIFEDEPADAPVRQVNWAVLTPPAGSTLKGKVVNTYGEQIRLPDIALNETVATSDGLYKGQWEVPVFPEHPLGAYRVEAWVEDAQAQRASTADEIVLFYLPRPYYWGQDGEDSPFGVHVISTRQHVQMAKAIGTNWIRTHDAGAISYVGWFFLEPEKGQWNFKDSAIQRYRDNNLMILGQLGTVPAWASPLQRVGPFSWTDRYYQPDDLDEFASYVRTVTERYKDEIRYWEIWNEPWLTSFWKVGLETDAQGNKRLVRSETAPQDFAELSKVSARAAHEIDPELKIVGLNSTASWYGRPGAAFSGQEWTDAVVDAGGMEGSAIASYHIYLHKYYAAYEGDYIERSFERSMGKLRDKETNEMSVPIWMTEGSNVRGITGRGFYYHSLPFAPGQEDTGHETGDKLVRYFASLLYTGSEKVFLYSMAKHFFFDNGSMYRVLLSEDGYLHPSAVSQAAMAKRIEGKTIDQVIQITPDTRVYVFRNEDEWTAIMINRDYGKSTLQIPQDTTGLELADMFGNAICAGSETPRLLFFVGGQGKFEPALLDAFKP